MADHDGSSERRRRATPPALPQAETFPETCPKTCMECRYSSWLVGIGQGFRCYHPQKKPANSYAWLIPSRTHVCELFEEKSACGHRTPSR